MYQVNRRKADVLHAIGEQLLHSELLLRFDVTNQGNATVLTVENETQTLEYGIYGDNQPTKMASVLDELKRLLPAHLHPDVDVVMEEAGDLVLS